MVRFGDAKELWSPVLQPVIDKHTSMSSPYLYASSVFLQHFFSKFLPMHKSNRDSSRHARAMKNAYRRARDVDEARRECVSIERDRRAVVEARARLRGPARDAELRPRLRLQPM
jgi:hypothetical protein